MQTSMTSVRIRHLMMGAAFVAGGIGGISPVFAQEAAEPAPMETVALQGFEEVMVTARRVEESMQSVPVAVTALSGDKLEKLGVKSVFDLKAAVPGLSVSTFNALDSLIVGVRGQRNQQVQPGQDPSIGTYFNDVPTGFQWGMNLGMFDLASVQTLKGPQGTLFGRNSTGGAVLISPNKPTNVFEGSVRAGVVGYDGGGGFSSTTIVNVPVTDTLAIRFGLDTVNRSGYIQNIADPALVDALVPPHPSVRPWPGGKATLKNLGSQDSQDWRIGVNWTPTDNFENYTVYSGSNYRSNGMAPQLIGINPDNPIANSEFYNGVGPIGPLGPIVDRFKASDNFWTTQTGMHLPMSIDQHAISNTSTLILGDVTIKNILAWKTIHRRWSSDSYGVPYQVTATYYPQNGWEISEELQASGTSFNGALEWVGGFFYFNNTMFHDFYGSSLTYSGRVTRANNITTALYGQGTYHLPWVEGLSVTGGVRYTADIRQLKNESYSAADPDVCRFNPLPVSGDCQVIGKRGFGRWTYTASANYQIDPFTMVYATNSTGYRAGGFNISEGNPERFAIGYRPESVDNYEIGLKRDWLFGDVQARTNVAAYVQKYTDIVRQAQNPDDARFALLVNATKATIRGVEAEIQVRPTDALTLGLAYSYVDAYYTGPFIVGGVDMRSNKFSLVPATTVSINAAYTLPLDSSYGAVVLGANYYRQSRFWFDDNNQGPAFGPLNYQSQGAYGLLDLRVDWESALESNFDVSLWVKNVGGTKYYTSMVPLYGSLGVAPAYVGQPRFVGFDVKYRFGG